MLNITANNKAVQVCEGGNHTPGLIFGPTAVFNETSLFSGRTRKAIYWLTHQGFVTMGDISPAESQIKQAYGKLPGATTDHFQSTQCPISVGQKT